MSHLGSEVLLSGTVLREIKEGNSEQALSTAQTLCTQILQRKLPRVSIRMRANIEGEPDQLAFIRTEGTTEVQAQVERINVRGKPKVSISMNCFSLGSGSSPEQARSLAYALLAAADAAETVAQNLTPKVTA